MKTETWSSQAEPIKNIHKVTEIRETRSLNEVNELVKGEWILLAAISTPEFCSFSLGRIPG